ncbi:MAG: fumarate hydratase [Clostridia bacterium]|nr:fumarate hydratase [Clostridia bacterium]
MRTIEAALIADTVRELCIKACTRLPGSVCALLDAARADEPFPPAQETLDLIIRNAGIAADTNVPICQDTGMAVVYADVGQDVHIVGGLLEDAVNEGVARGYTDGYLRKSIVRDPIRRGNTGDNTPAVLHTRLVPGDRIRLTVSPKGFGSENMSKVCMLTPADGLEGVKRFVKQTVLTAGANPCPPMMLGIGIGGTFEKVAQLAKEALVELREGPHPDPYYDALENELLREINALGIGPQGFGGRTTALSVRIKTYPTHIAGLPVAVNVGCHVTRHAEAVL